MNFPRYFNPAELGGSLKEVATDLIHTKRNLRVVSRWFHSAKDADLFIWLDPNNNIIKQQLTFHGQVVEWNVVEGVKTGMIVEEEDRPDVKGSEIVQFDSIPQATPLEYARALLQHVEVLEEEEKSSLITNFNLSEARGAIDAAEFVERFGAFLEPRREGHSEGPSFWTRLRRLLFG